MYPESFLDKLKEKPGDKVTLLAWADYLQENNKNKYLETGLRWCVEHNKYPSDQLEWSWQIKGSHYLSRIFIPICGFYNSIEYAIYELGAFIHFTNGNL